MLGMTFVAIGRSLGVLGNGSTATVVMVALLVTFTLMGAPWYYAALSLVLGLIIPVLGRRAAREKWLGVFFVSFVIGSFTLSTLAAWTLGNNMSTLTYQGTAASAVLLFFASFPVINAVFDWLSLGITRRLLSESLWSSQGPIGYCAFAFGDFLAATIVLTALLSTKILWILWLNLLLSVNGVGPLLDLQSLRSAVASDPRNLEHIWIYGIVLTTLIPTYFHLVFAAGSGLSIRFPYVKEFIKANAEDEHPRGWMHVASVGLLTGQNYLAALLAFFFLSIIASISVALGTAIFNTIVNNYDWIAF